ncbi:uncharacterized protein LOC129965545 isoform X2 [Argiope bruennichi]|uniref:uncharacterized protein LOC129965545 isoform X2 n=1 Tax=Argiope bruennichi TaxID=94029 RepID=UPI002493F283|nr:uncharacterized protein LOC129965545 isoform X2 [Argiope bruennichi]
MGNTELLLVAIPNCARWSVTKTGSSGPKTRLNKRARDFEIQLEGDAERAQHMEEGKIRKRKFHLSHRDHSASRDRMVM